MFKTETRAESTIDALLENNFSILSHSMTSDEKVKYMVKCNFCNDIIPNRNAKLHRERCLIENVQGTTTEIALVLQKLNMLEQKIDSMYAHHMAYKFFFRKNFQKY
jgi:hypothetical protein